MDDAANEDARPLTKEERDMLIGCLFGLAESLFSLSKMHTEVLAALEKQTGQNLISREAGKDFFEEMKIVTGNILELGEKFGVLKNG